MSYELNMNILRSVVPFVMSVSREERNKTLSFSTRLFSLGTGVTKESPRFGKGIRCVATLALGFRLLHLPEPQRSKERIQLPIRHQYQCRLFVFRILTSLRLTARCFHMDYSQSKPSRPMVGYAEAPLRGTFTPTGLSSFQIVLRTMDRFRDVRPSDPE